MLQSEQILNSDKNVGFCLLSLDLLISFQGILVPKLCHFSHNFARILEYLFFSEVLCHFFNFLIKKISQHLNLFPKNPNAFKVNNDNKIQWKNIIIICSEIPFSKNTYHKETSQLIWFETHYNWLVSTWYEFLVKDIFGQTLTLLLYLRLNLAVHQSWSSMNALFTFNSRNVSIGLKKNR